MAGGFTHRLEGGKVHHRIDGVARKNAVQRRAVADIHPLKHRRLAADLLQPVQHLGRAVREIIHPHHRKAGLLQRNPGVRADVAGGAGEQHRGHVGYRAAGHCSVSWP